MLKVNDVIFVLVFVQGMGLSYAQNHPQLYITNNQKNDFLERTKSSERVSDFLNDLKSEIKPLVERHVQDPEWILSRLQMYWNNKYERVFVNGMDFSHGEGSAPVPTVRFSGSRDWATDYLQPELEEIKPYLDDDRGMYLQNRAKENHPWEWVHPAETGHIIERINREILELAEDAAFTYWLTGEEHYAQFAADILMKYLEGMYYREPPQTVGDHKNALLMGLQTFEVIHEGIIEPITVCYDFLYDFLIETGKDVQMVQEVFRRWADQEIKYGVPGNNWNMMQARFITYLAIALEDDAFYQDGKGQQYYIDQVLNQNSAKQKALKDVLKNFDPVTAIWPEVAHYSIMVSDDLLEIYSLMDKTLNNNLLQASPILEKAIFANFHYLFPNDFTTAYGDAKHARLRFNSLELLIAQYRKYEQQEKEVMITKQLKRFIENEAYQRDEIKSLFELFFYEEELLDVPPATSIGDMVTSTFYSPNVSWVVQRNGASLENGMMVSKNASLGNHSHTNGINIELFAKGMVIAPDAAAGVSYWSPDHIEYYSRFPAHNTVVVDGISDYRNMRGSQAFELKAIYPSTTDTFLQEVNYTFADVRFHEPSTGATQERLTGTIRTGPSSGYFVDIFRSSRDDGQDKKHEYIFHGQGAPVLLTDQDGKVLKMRATDELSSHLGDLVGYDYFKDKSRVDYTGDFRAHFSMPSLLGENLQVNLWMKGYEQRSIFTVMAPYSRAIHPASVPEELYHQPLPTLVVRQTGEAISRPFVSIIDAYTGGDTMRVNKVSYFSSMDSHPDFVGIVVKSGSIHVDYIYSDAGGKIKHDFKDGAFIGTYGVASFNQGILQSLLLSKGRYLEKGDWKIENTQPDGQVLVLVNGAGLIVDAEQPFKLTMPVSTAVEGQEICKRLENFGKQEFAGKVLVNENRVSVEIDLPAMKYTEVRLRD